jgi:hypothetical protein
MSEIWLKLIGSRKNPYSGHYENLFVDFSKSKRPRAIHPGDQMVLYAAGGSKRLFALAEVTSEVYENNEYEDYPYRVDVNYDVNLPVSVGVHIDEISTLERNLLGAVQGSYLRLKPEEFELAVSKLQEAKQIYDAT